MTPRQSNLHLGLLASWPLGAWIHLASRHARLSKRGFNFLMIVLAVTSTACNRKSTEKKGASISFRKCKYLLKNTLQARAE